MELVIKPSELHKLDPRAEIFGWSPDERYKLVESVAINSAVPEHVQRLIVTSKNLIIHSCLYYPFNITEVQTAFSALELAIRLRAENEGLKIVFKGLRGAMEFAVRSSWVSDNGIPIPPPPKTFHLTSDGEIEEIDAPILRPYVEVLAEFMPKIRNELAHGSGYLHSGGASKVLMINHLINQIFPDIAST